MARTIADLEDSTIVKEKHLLEALNFQNAGRYVENRASA
ncbi:magnesium chelatase, subunit ChlI domain protein [Leptospira kirschneri str. 200801925]|nr:magnesium chelatase, subunit ChlI domain protein [Leptospira kirschneri str. 200801925]